jgi:hypothetical protein
VCCGVMGRRRWSLRRTRSEQWQEGPDPFPAPELPYTHTTSRVCWVSNASSSIGKQMHPLLPRQQAWSGQTSGRLHTLRKAHWHTPLMGCGFWSLAPRVTHTSCTLPSEVMLYPHPIYTLSCFNLQLEARAGKPWWRAGWATNRQHESADRQSLFFGCSWPQFKHTHTQGPTARKPPAITMAWLSVLVPVTLALLAATDAQGVFVACSVPRDSGA